MGETELVKVALVPKEHVLERMENEVPFRLVEVLSREAYEDGHLPGAINIPLREIEELGPRLLGKAEEIVVYCSSYACHASTKAARALSRMGYTRVLDYKGGKADWAQAGLPLET